MVPGVKRADRRRAERSKLEIKSLEDAHRFVEIINKRNVENNSGLKAWRFAKQAAWLLLLVAAFLAYYLIDVVHYAVSMP